MRMYKRRSSGTARPSSLRPELGASLPTLAWHPCRAHGPSNTTSRTSQRPPAGFTIVDVLAMGSAGHGIGAGIVLGLKGIGAL